MTCPSPRVWFPNMAVEDSLGSMQPFKKGPLTKLPEKFPNVGTSDEREIYIWLYLFIFNSIYKCFSTFIFFLEKGTHTPPLWGCFFFKKNQPTKTGFFCSPRNVSTSFASCALSWWWICRAWPRRMRMMSDLRVGKLPIRWYFEWWFSLLGGGCPTRFPLQFLSFKCFFNDKKDVFFCWGVRFAKKRDFEGLKFFWKGAQLQFKSAHDMFVERCRSIFAGSSNNSKMLDFCPTRIPKINLMLYLSFFCKDPNDWNNAITPQKSVDFSRHHDHLEEDNSKRLDAKLQLKCSWFLFSPQKEWNRSVCPVLVSNILTQIPRASCFAIPQESCFTRLASWNSSKSVFLFQL